MKISGIQKKRLSQIGKILVSIVLLIFILRRVDLKESLAIIKNANFLLMGLSIILVYLGIFISSVRLSLLIYSQYSRQAISFMKILFSYHAATFFNSLLPTTIGGDFLKAGFLAPTKKVLPRFVLYSLVERFSGILALLIISSMSIPFVSGHFPWFLLLLPPILLSAISLILFFIFLNTQYQIVRFHQKIEKLARTKLIFSRLFLGRIIPISLLFQFTVITFVYLVAHSIQLDIRFIDLSFMIAISTLFLLLPISINGVGVREFIYIYLFSFLGIGVNGAAVLSLILFTINTLTNYTGYVSYILIQWKVFDHGDSSQSS